MFGFLFQCSKEFELLLEVFFVALTNEINFLEEKKYDEDYDANKIMELERKIAPRFLTLGEYLREYPELTRECVLTAFSMHPNAEYFDYVIIVARQIWPELDLDDDGEPAADAQSRNSDSIRIDALQAAPGTSILQTSDYDAKEAPSIVLDALTHLSDDTRSDISCLINVSRIKSLSWALPWLQLKQQCQKLLFSETEKLNIVDKSTALANSKLQYLDLNYADYRDLRPHEYPGIERGYEIYAPRDSSSDMDAGGEPDTDSAPESKVFRTREQRRLSARKLRHRKIIEKGLEDRSLPVMRRPVVVEAKRRKPRKRTHAIAASSLPAMAEIAATQQYSSVPEAKSVPSASEIVPTTSASSSLQCHTQSTPLPHPCNSNPDEYTYPQYSQQPPVYNWDPITEKFISQPIAASYDPQLEVESNSLPAVPSNTPTEPTQVIATQQETINAHQTEIPNNTACSPLKITSPDNPSELCDGALNAKKILPKWVPLVLCTRRGRKKDPTRLMKYVRHRIPVSLKQQCKKLFLSYGVSAVEIIPKKVRGRRESVIPLPKTAEEQTTKAVRSRKSTTPKASVENGIQMEQSTLEDTMNLIHDIPESEQLSSGDKANVGHNTHDMHQSAPEETVDFTHKDPEIAQPQLTEIEYSDSMAVDQSTFGGSVNAVSCCPTNGQSATKEVANSVPDSLELKHSTCEDNERPVPSELSDSVENQPNISLAKNALASPPRNTSSTMPDQQKMEANDMMSYNLPSSPMKSHQTEEMSKTSNALIAFNHDLQCESNSNSMAFGPMISSSLELVYRGDSPSVLCDYATMATSVVNAVSIPDHSIIETTKKPTKAPRRRRPPKPKAEVKRKAEAKPKAKVRSRAKADSNRYRKIHANETKTPQKCTIQSPSSSESFSPDINIYGENFMIGNEINPRALNDILGIPFTPSDNVNVADENGESPVRNPGFTNDLSDNVDDIVPASIANHSIAVEPSDCSNVPVESASPNAPAGLSFADELSPTVVLERINLGREWTNSDEQRCQPMDSDPAALAANMQRRPVIVRNQVPMDPANPLSSIHQNENAGYMHPEDIQPSTNSSMLAYSTPQNYYTRTNLVPTQTTMNSMDVDVYNTGTWQEPYSSIMAYNQYGGSDVNATAQFLGACVDVTTAECSSPNTPSLDGHHTSQQIDLSNVDPSKEVVVVVDPFNTNMTASPTSSLISISSSASSPNDQASKPRNPLLAYRRPPKKTSTHTSQFQIRSDYISNNFTMNFLPSTSSGVESTNAISQPSVAEAHQPTTHRDSYFSALNTLAYVALTPLEHTEFYKTHRAKTSFGDQSSSASCDEGIEILTKHCTVPLERVETTEYKAMYHSAVARAEIRAETRNDVKVPRIPTMILMDDDESDDEESRSSVGIDIYASISKQRTNYKYDDDDDYFIGGDDKRARNVLGSNGQRYQTNQPQQQQKEKQQQSSQSNGNARNQQNCRHYLNKVKRRESSVFLNGKSY